MSDSDYWSLYEDGKKLEPLKYSNGKTQEDVVKEVVELIRAGKKVIFIHGVCGTGKSAIALNIARNIGRTSIIVPLKNLQKQYADDYTGKKHLIDKNGAKMEIGIITGRANHDCLIFPNTSCDDPFLPDTILITEKNKEKIFGYYSQNPLIKNKINPKIHSLRRISIAPSNPYWSPICPANFELNQLSDAEKKCYKGVSGRDYIFYHRKKGCGYYDQFQAYINSDIIIFNSAKYNIEMAIGRKPFTEVDIIDEADLFLDNFSEEASLNLTHFISSLHNLNPDNFEARKQLDDIWELANAEIRNKKALGINEDDIFSLKDTILGKMLKALIKSEALQAEIIVDEKNYANTALEVAMTFDDLFNETYVIYHKKDDNIHASLVTTNVEKRFAELKAKTNVLILMSGTLHSKHILENVFKIKDFSIVEAETKMPGTIEITEFGHEIDCSHKKLNSSEEMRTKYLYALSKSLEMSKKPALIHVNAYKDLPDEREAPFYPSLEQRNSLKLIQNDDKEDRRILEFKEKKKDILFSTKCSRGVDFPGEICNSIIFTKYPNPNTQDPFWKILKKTHNAYFWSIYSDKARREFLQRIYRALRSQDDHVYILSPDLRVIDAVKRLIK